MHNDERVEMLAKILEETPGGIAMGGVPTSAIKSLRGNRSQYEVALKAGITQAQLSRLEHGLRSLSPEIARGLGPALGVTGEQLLVSEDISKAQRLALKGRLDPRRLLDAVMEVAVGMPDSQVADDLVDAMLSVLKQALETYNVDAGKAPAAVATKADRARPDRDGFGRRVHKPMQGRS